MADDPLGLLALDYIELYVGNAKHAAHYYRTLLGLEPQAYAGLETGRRDSSSYVLGRRDIRFVFTAALTGDHPAAQSVARRGDGVKDVALRVANCDAAYRAALERGAKSVMEPTVMEDKTGKVKRAAIAAYGEVIHSLVERADYAGPFLPGYRAWNGVAADDRGLQLVDHVVANVELGKMNDWVNFYRDIMGFEQLVHYDDKDISTEYSALMSKVMQDGKGRIKFPINEPAEGRRKSQIQEYLDYYGCPGVQHIAMLTPDIVKTVEGMRTAGMQFLRVPDTYYQQARERVGKIDEKFEDLERLGILVDRDDEGYLLQIFTNAVEDRPTMFLEVIQRKGSRGFGKGNFKALFEALEAEQERRGNL